MKKNNNYIVIPLRHIAYLDIDTHVLFIKLKKNFLNIFNKYDFSNQTPGSIYYRNISQYYDDAFICNMKDLFENIWHDPDDVKKEREEKDDGLIKLSNLHKIIISNIIDDLDGNKLTTSTFLQLTSNGKIYHIPYMNHLKKYLKNVLGVEFQKFTIHILYNNKPVGGKFRFCLRYDTFETEFGIEHKDISIYSNVFYKELIADALNPNLFLVTA